LELGIDIGSVDKVIQIDATHSIASLIQRVGRSGRKDGESSNLFLYATDKWSLVQSIACWLLYKENFIEPPESNEKPYDILVHQALSITKGHSGILLVELIKQLKENSAFQLIEQSEIQEILHHLIEIDFLEKLQHEVIIGVDGEKVVNSRDFYSVFKTEENFKVLNSSNTIGEIPFSPQIIEDENILLSAKIWKIKFVDQKAKRIEVIPAKDGKKPIFFGGGAVVHQKIREKMFEITFSKSEYDFLDESGLDEITIMRNDFSVININNFQSERPLLTKDKQLYLFTFTGTRINRTIQLLLNIAGIKNTLDDSSSSFEIDASLQELKSKWIDLSIPLSDIDYHISILLTNNPTLLEFSKWGMYLPERYKIKLIKNKYQKIKYF
jgi:ATP-dependent Lhr-like helicase